MNRNGKFPMEDELDWNEKVCREIMYIDDEDEFIRLHIQKYTTIVIIQR